MWGFAGVFVQGCCVVMQSVVLCFHFQVVVVHFSSPLGWCAVSIWDSRGCIFCPVIKVVHSERAAMVLSLKGLCMLREYVVIFSFHINKLFVGPCEYFISVRVVDVFPCVLPSSSCGSYPFAIPFHPRP